MKAMPEEHPDHARAEDVPGLPELAAQALAGRLERRESRPGSLMKKKDWCCRACTSGFSSAASNVGREVPAVEDDRVRGDRAQRRRELAHHPRGASCDAPAPPAPAAGGRSRSPARAGPRGSAARPARRAGGAEPCGPRAGPRRASSSGEMSATDPERHAAVEGDLLEARSPRGRARAPTPHGADVERHADGEEGEHSRGPAVIDTTPIVTLGDAFARMDVSIRRGSSPTT